MRATFIVTAILVCLAEPIFGQDAFVPQCTLPYAQIAKKNPIDKSCPPQGQPLSEEHGNEYRAKNNLCAPDPAIDVTLADLIAMQKDAERIGVPIGQRDTAIPNREVLKGIHEIADGNKIGEGNRVRVVTFLIGAKPTGARHPDGTAGEGVNCKHPGATVNDIHIDIGARPGAQACDGIVIEMIPHYRPQIWNSTNLRKIGSRPIRVTGQLFFDSRHHLSTCGQPSPGDPPRSSLWEIHPVYAVDVCKATSPADCAIGDDGKWVSFDRWLGSGAAKAAKLIPKQQMRQHLKTE